MSGSGKSTLAEYAYKKLSSKGLSVLVLDGDTVRDKYKIKLSFGHDDIKKNNINVANFCKQERYNYDVIIVSMISPIESMRVVLRKLLSPKYYLIYISANIETLKERDVKGLYKMADNGEITGLIGYSERNPYDIPVDFDLIVDTNNQSDLNKSKNMFVQFILQKLTI